MSHAPTIIYDNLSLHEDLLTKFQDSLEMLTSLYANCIGVIQRDVKPCSLEQRILCEEDQILVDQFVMDIKNVRKEIKEHLTHLPDTSIPIESLRDDIESLQNDIDAAEVLYSSAKQEANILLSELKQRLNNFYDVELSSSYLQVPPEE